MPQPVSRFFRTVLLLSVLGAFLAFPLATANAQPVQKTITTTITDIPRSVGRALDKAYQAVRDKLKIATDIAFKNGTRTFLATVTQEFATSLATTGPGQKPLFLTKPKTFFRDVADAAGGDFIDDFSRGLTGATFDEELGVVGGTTGGSDPFSSSRRRFVISRILREATDATGSLCVADCEQLYGISGVSTVINPQAISSFNEVPGANTHTKAISLMNGWLDSPNGGMEARARANPSEPVTCPDVVAQTGPSQSGDTIYQFSFGVCRGTSGGASCTMSARECVSALKQAKNIEGQIAQDEKNECINQCNRGIGGSARKSIRKATASDFFEAADTVETETTPASVAVATSRDGSDVGSLFNAFALLTATVQEKVLGEETNLNAGLLPRTSSVSEEVLTPKEAASALFGVPFYNSSGELTYTGTGAADILKGIASFINSPIGKALTTYFKTKCGLNPDVCKGPSNIRSSIGRILFGSGGQTGVAGARLQFAGLGKTEILTGNPGRNEIDVADQLNASGLIDAQFRTAIQEQLTLAQAVGKSLIDPRKPFGFDRNGIEPTDGYPYRALQYLRKFRIIPVGWELAAKYSQRFLHDDLTLGVLTDHYNICAQDDQHKVCSETISKSCTQNSDCPVSETCGASPYCGLVDPNWVLKAPQTYCRRQGAGEEILTKEFVCDQNNVRKSDGTIIPAGQDDRETQAGVLVDNDAPNCVYDAVTNPHPDVGRWVVERNTDICADTQSCIAENEDGTCIAFGYCVQERPSFKFDGTQCSPENASCTTYISATGKRASYLASTLDFANCNADVAGCQWYCQQPSYDATTKTWTCSETTGQKINLTAKAETCTAGQVGCRQFIRIMPGSNVLPNRGFEQFDGGAVGSTAASFPGWSTCGIGLVPVISDDTLVTSNNQTAAQLSSGSAGDLLRQTIDAGAPLFERTFTASIHAESASACTARLTLCTGVSCAASAVKSTVDVNVTGTWQAYGASITVPAEGSAGASGTQLSMEFDPGTCSGTTLTVDNAQLEEQAGISAYKEYGTANILHLNDTRQSCTVNDVGCELYTPTAGGSAVTGIARGTDRCDQASVGCALFRLEGIDRVPFRNSDDVTVVPTRGQQCSAADVGCEEYTNLDEVARGGEGKAYFKTVKQCVKPNAPAGKQTYYTWVGDAQRGYVLRSYDLVPSNMISGNGGRAPCTSLTFGTATQQPVCNDGDAVALAKAQCARTDVGVDPECAEYFDAELRAYYVRRSFTVSVTDECSPYRNTIDQTDSQYAANKDRVYYLSPKENLSCGAAAAGCRAYTGNAGRTTRNVLRDDFEREAVSKWVGGAHRNASVQIGGHSMEIAQGAVAYTVADALNNQITAGKTYNVSFLGAAASNQPNTKIKAYLGSVNGSGQFEARQELAFQPVGGGAAVAWNDGITPAGPEWNQYTLGPLRMTTAAPAGVRLAIVTEGGPAYVDTVVLTEINDSLYLVASTVPQCAPEQVGCAAYRDRGGNDQYLKSFSRICSERVVGCEAMIDTKNSTTPFAQTVKNVTTPADSVVTLVNNPASYCPASAKGCEMLGEPTYIADNTLSGFKTVYKKNNPDRHSGDLCEVQEIACQAYTTTEGTTAFFKDPGTKTCEFKSDASGSRWVMSGTDIRCPTVAGQSVARPVGASCSPICQGGSRNGKACSSSADCAGGSCVGDASTAGLVRGTDGSYTVGQCTSDAQCGLNSCVYLVGTCPDGENGCTEYRDPSDPQSCRSECTLTLQGGSPIYLDASCSPTKCRGGIRNGQNCQTSAQCGAGSECVGADGTTPTLGAPGCRAYTYLRQTIEDTAVDCNGEVNSDIGCRPFNDTSKTDLNFRGQ